MQCVLPPRSSITALQDTNMVYPIVISAASSTLETSAYRLAITLMPWSQISQAPRSHFFVARSHHVSLARLAFWLERRWLTWWGCIQPCLPRGSSSSSSSSSSSASCSSSCSSCSSSLPSSSSSSSFSTLSSPSSELFSGVGSLLKVDTTSGRPRYSRLRLAFL